MFGKKESANDGRPLHVSASRSDSVTFVAEDCFLQGILTSTGNVRIDGKLDGSVAVHGDFIAGESAVVHADIESTTATIAGEVHGNLRVTGLLELSSSARVYGDVVAGLLRIDQGARFVGSSSFLDPNAATDEPPTLSLVTDEVGMDILDQGLAAPFSAG